MADTIPQIRVRADTQSQDGSSRAEGLARVALKESTNRKGLVPSTTSDDTEGMYQLILQHGDMAQCFVSLEPAADADAAARPLSIGRSYPSKLKPSLSGNQANNIPKTANSEGRRDSQGIDPLSHVR